MAIPEDEMILEIDQNVWNVRENGYFLMTLAIFLGIALLLFVFGNMVTSIMETYSEGLNKMCLCDLQKQKCENLKKEYCRNNQMTLPT